MQKVGILRGSSLNPYEGQYFKKLVNYGFEPIGITTPDNSYKPEEIPFAVRVGHSYRTITKGKLVRLQRYAKKATGYNFESYNFRMPTLKKITKDLDVIHSADIQYPYTYQAVKTGKPTVVTEWENIPFNFEEPPYNSIKKYNRQHVKHFIAITEKAKDALIQEGVKSSKITVIPAGIDCEFFKPTQRNSELLQKFGLSKEATKILFVGRFVPEKGIFDLLRAFSMLLRKEPNLELLIVGSGTAQMKAEIRQLVSELKFEGKIKFLGSISYPEMPKIHNLADVFCLPSVKTKTWAEQFGYSLVEAMACAKPAVSTWSGSIPEIVKDKETGFLVGESDPVALEAALEGLVLNKVEREKLGANARQWVLQRFEADKVASQIADVYRNVLA